MGGRSAKLQKQMFPRSRTKREVLQDKLTGNVPSYPSVPASTQKILVDPDNTPQYTNLLKNVALNIQSSSDNFKFKEYSMNKPSDLLEGGTPTPPGFLDKDMLNKIFITEKGTPDLHTRVGLAEEELQKIYSCFTGFKVHQPAEEDELMNDLRKDANDLPMRRSDTPGVKQHMLYAAEHNRRKENKDGIDLENT